MDVKDLFWDDIALRLSRNYILKSPPSTWKKGEVNVFLEHFKKEVVKFRIENEMSNDLDIKISYDTFRRILIKRETQGSDYSRNIFAQYFGEPTYLEYSAKLNQEKNTEVASPVKPKSKKFTLSLIGLILICLSVAVCTFFAKQKANDTCVELKTIIQDAIKAEFSAYKSVPNYDQSLKNLEEYFFPADHAFKKIEQVLANEKRRNWILSNPNNVSTAELIDVTCEFIDDDIATMRSKEHWVIQWFDTKMQEYSYLYDTINTQIYYLKKNENNKWKISINNYGKKKNRIFVKIFNDSDFVETISTNELKSKIINFMSNGDTQNAIWWLSKYAKLKSLPILEDVVILQGTINSNIRRVNTNELEIAKYYELNKEVDQKILDLLKQV